MRRPNSPFLLFTGTLLLCLALAVTGWATAARAASQQLKLEDFVLDNAEGQLAIRFGVGIQDKERLRVMLKEGAVITLTCEATLSDTSGMWLNTTLARQEMVSTLSFNALTREYAIAYEGSPAVYRNANLMRLLSETWERLSLKVGQLVNLERGREYRVDLSVRMQNDNVPPWLSKTLFFWSWDIAPTMRYSMNFIF
ncbi:DUF4390 domain-containing protein [Desulfovibrio psychrotolerans]|uniref:DUF4390 domain-containing protein n=1 Tax=Desulfovibrio psychrotolerans TaxID=415242 RepID=A0A7J0BS93_9BACT|nr:DUF4390 domain-containing protein [Desulfovibrio psychrotolerans]GFM36052.1 hypothetical protein DSM19430T_07360 [Desulfovibrio psychrotolerans]